MGLLDYTMFLRESFLFEKKETKAKVFQRPFFAAFKKLFPNELDPQGTKPGEAIRARFGFDGDGTAEKNIEKLFSEIKIKDEKSDTVEKGIPIDSIDVHPPGQMRMEGYGSNDYSTYEVKSGADIYWVTNASAATAEGGVQEIGRQQLKPANLKLNGTYKSAIELCNATVSAINGLSWMKQSTKDFLIGLAKATAKNTTPEFTDMTTFFASMSYAQNVSVGKLTSDLDPRSLQNVINDFGEVLDGIFILALVETFVEGLSFPLEPNKPLLDIECDKYMISSKDATKGGKPSAATILDAMKNTKALALTDKEEIDLCSILSPTPAMSTWDQYIHVADALQQRGHLKDSAYQVLIDAMKIKGKPTIEAAEEYVKNLSDNEYTNLVDSMAQKANRTFKEPVLKVRKGFSEIGPAFVNISKEVGDALNANYQDQFSSVVTKIISLKQIYLKIRFRDENLEFVAKASQSMKAKFDTSKSAPKLPFNARISFQFIQ